jgi:hypothetical protein
MKEITKEIEVVKKFVCEYCNGEFNNIEDAKYCESACSHRNKFFEEAALIGSLKEIKSFIETRVPGVKVILNRGRIEENFKKFYEVKSYLAIIGYVTFEAPDDESFHKATSFLSPFSFLNILGVETGTGSARTYNGKFIGGYDLTVKFDYLPKFKENVEKILELKKEKDNFLKSQSQYVQDKLLNNQERNSLLEEIQIVQEKLQDLLTELNSCTVDIRKQEEEKFQKNNPVVISLEEIAQFEKEILQ